MYFCSCITENRYQWSMQSAIPLPQRGEPYLKLQHVCISCQAPYRTCMFAICSCVFMRIIWVDNPNLVLWSPCKRLKLRCRKFIFYFQVTALSFSKTLCIYHHQPLQIAFMSTAHGTGIWRVEAIWPCSVPKVASHWSCAASLLVIALLFTALCGHTARPPRSVCRLHLSYIHTSLIIL